MIHVFHKIIIQNDFMLSIPVDQTHILLYIRKYSYLLVNLNGKGKSLTNPSKFDGSGGGWRWDFGGHRGEKDSVWGGGSGTIIVEQGGGRGSARGDLDETGASFTSMEALRGVRGVGTELGVGKGGYGPFSLLQISLNFLEICISSLANLHRGGFTQIIQICIN